MSDEKLYLISGYYKKRFYLFKNTIRGNFGEVDKPLKNTEIVDLLNKQQATIKDLNEENEQLKIANARWLDKSLQDKQIRYDNLTCNELTKKYLQLKEENEQLRKELEKLKLLNESLGLFMNE